MKDQKIKVEKIGGENKMTQNKRKTQNGGACNFQN